ncbi:hypothetical protein IVB40_28335 [Bradyrhizobium sp. 40]|jgi:hypothetical protein|uniref:hypothetical protein n=1 Tax=unclassified Bradyrhizobium TaxID=2631580 RepID=UPI001FF9943A|nr:MULTISPECIES: hypothetical protein [unclassified Bradyrhizobium]MCK1397462.1 hypothetical protein [Bradyrhizobium sp. 39]MCK1659204.1 hypothetical protein [Bradyrhizobium sp. 151]MCK1752499.1 hypothetical protein [Bradyrhizobium sp. 135]UPJ36720.1 hypothetical protein IVB45_07740 [Bradyrhizobium sp. 4]UPJ41158.1 hypothetical protein IVB40_28335 [Bradyrhizobium sp. 40]
MFQLFLRARAHNFLSSRREDKGFKARTIERDAETDRVRIDAVMVAIDAALRDAEREQVGLGRRVDDALARASVTFGNGTDEYLEREPIDSHHQDLFAADISNGQRRLKELASTIAHLRFVRTAMLTRFPNLKPPQLNS